MRRTGRLLDLLYPRLCPACGRALSDGEGRVCRDCLFTLPRARLPLITENPACDRLAGRVPFQRAAACFTYAKDGPVQTLFEEFKYHGNRELARELGAFAAGLMEGSGLFEGVDVLIPVPLHPRKLRTRGYNQSREIALGIATRTGLSVEENAVRRVRFTSTQTRKSSWDRQENVQDAFEAVDPAILTGKNVLVVDDVLTTGATLEACGRAVLKAGARQLGFFALALA